MDLLMVIMGWLVHHLKVLRDIHKGTGELLSPIGYIKKRPYSFLLSIVGTTIGTILTITLYQPEIRAGFGENTTLELQYLGTLAAVGIAGDLVADKLTTYMSFKR